MNAALYFDYINVYTQVLGEFCENFTNSLVVAVIVAVAAVACHIHLIFITLHVLTDNNRIYGLHIWN